MFNVTEWQHNYKVCCGFVILGIFLLDSSTYVIRFLVCLPAVVVYSVIFCFVLRDVLPVEIFSDMFRHFILGICYNIHHHHPPPHRQSSPPNPPPPPPPPPPPTPPPPPPPPPQPHAYTTQKTAFFIFYPVSGWCTLCVAIVWEYNTASIFRICIKGTKLKWPKPDGNHNGCRFAVTNLVEIR
jgi:hypothetical protein